MATDQDQPAPTPASATSPSPSPVPSETTPIINRDASTDNAADQQPDDAPPAYGTFSSPSESSTHHHHHHHDSGAVPTYSASDPSTSLSESISLLRQKAEAASLSLPITQYYPDSVTVTVISPSSSSKPAAPKEEEPESPSASTTRHQIISAFFRAILARNDELITLFVSSGLVSPDVPNARGCTPLVAAVASGFGGTVCTLVNLGADVNKLGRYDEEYYHTCDLARAATSEGVDTVAIVDAIFDDEATNDVVRRRSWAVRRLREMQTGVYGRLRTPLMVAAARGNIALVKLLVGDFKADDSIIAPEDGQLALRLAADRGHREIVAYLPARRGGEWRRWKAHHAVAVRRFKKAGHKLYEFCKFFVWHVPRFFVWSCPKHLVVRPAVKAGKWAWENKQYFGGWCKRQAKEMPRRMKKAVGKVGKGIKAVGREVRKVPGLLVDLVKWLVKVVKRIPGAMKIVAVWIWESLKKIGIATGHVFLRVVSAVHTAVMAVLGFFQRITLKDIVDGFSYVLKAIFVELPKAIWSGVKNFGDVSYKALKKLLGWVGELIWFLCLALFWLVIFIPKQLWRMLAAIGSSMAKGYHEILVWLNPKH